MPKPVDVKLPNSILSREVAKRGTKCQMCGKVIKAGQERITSAGYWGSSYPRSGCIPCFKKAMKKLGLV